MKSNIKSSKVETNSDIARNTILVLLILTIVLSVISTWIVLDTINQVKTQYLSLPKSTVLVGGIDRGQINVEVANPNNLNNPK